MNDTVNSMLVPVDKLRWTCDPDTLGVQSTAEAEPLDEKVISQERAVSALKFGMKMPGNDYNIFVAGEPRTGLTYLTRSFLQDAARNEPTPPDRCYVFNFDDPDEPKAISLPAGRAKDLAKDMDELVEELQSQIPEAFESDDYRHRREEIYKEFTLSRNELLGGLEKKVNDDGFILNMSQDGMMIVPAVDGKPMTEENLNQLSEEEKTKLRETSEKLQEEMNTTVVNLRKMERDLKEKLKDLDRRVALAAVGYQIDELQTKYEGLKSVNNYLRDVKNDVIRNLEDFKRREQQPQMPFPMPQQNEPDFTRYKVNVLIDNTDLHGAPVVYEVNPTYTNLFGAMERRASFGALFTDFTMIKAGAVHRANGGYLVIQAQDILKWYISWEAMKRALKNKQIKIEDPVEMLGIMTVKGMKPEPIELNIKILLIGEPHIYQLLHFYDEQFSKLFKVKAELDDLTNRNDDEIQKYISFATKMVKQRGLLHVNKTGLARLMEYGVEIAGRQKKLTLQMAVIRDVLREADYWAREEGCETIGCEHVDNAIRHKKFRSNLVEYRMQEHMLDGYVNVDTDGAKVGQINGLSVYNLGDYMFGRPSRITASVSLGRQGVVAIDRESKMSGSIHTKGVLIMEGYLKNRYAVNRPLSLSASLVFEQSYGMVDGDSASVAELIVLLSRIAEVPLRQDLAITGAISQVGEAQPIGGVNHKIEGFYELCMARGLTGNQGVIIPQSNVADLMLKGQVIDAVKAGKFKVWAVSRADQAIEILTGMPAGERGEDGQFPEGTFNRVVEDKLTELAEKAKKFMKDAEEGGKADSEGPEGCDSCSH